MNSVQFFSDMVGESSTGLRSDILEKNYLKFHSQIEGERVGELIFDVGGESVSAGENANLYLDLPAPADIFLFCMAGLADGPEGLIPGEASGEVMLSERFTEFGDHVLVVKNNAEFSSRLNAAIAKHPGLYSSDFYEGGHGQVEYVDMHRHSGIVGLFRKDMEYAWQREYRFCVGATSDAKNSKGALELDIGDISDISQIIPTDKFVSSPISLRRGVIENINGVLRHIYTDRRN